MSNEKNNFADNLRVEPAVFLMENLSFSMKLFSGHFYGQSFIKTVQGPFCCGFASLVFVVIIVCYVVCSFKFLEETFTLPNNFFTSLVNQEGSDCLILIFLLGIYLSNSSEIRLVISDAFMSISLIFSDSQSVSQMSRYKDW